MSTTLTIKKLLPVRLCRLTRKNWFLICSSSFGVTIVVFVGVDWTAHRELAPWLIAFISWAKEALDSVRHFLEVMEEQSEL